MHDRIVPCGSIGAVRCVVVVAFLATFADLVRSQETRPLPPDALTTETRRAVADLEAASRAASGSGATTQPTSTDVPRLEIVRTAEPPVIDGILDDACWSAAALIPDLTQVEPVQGAPPTEKTEVRFLFDSDNIYLGVRCHDRDAGAIVSTQMVRDADLEPDDRIELVFDTFHDRRNAYFFQINPTGAGGDALIENSGNFNKNWDGIWQGKASRDATGWSAEFALPYKTLSFNPNSETWGFNISRFIKRKSEEGRWASPGRDFGVFNIGKAGVLAGIRDIQQGLGLEIRPSLSLRHRHDRDRQSDVFSPEPSLDIYYKLTPSFTAALTVNTDFAETDVDERQVNLTRFPLFFPEKRDFFLQDAGIFTFGGIRRAPNPFFSRRIGIDREGQPVDILAGLKLTGRIDRFNIGILDTQVDESAKIDSKNLGVARVAMNVLERSTVGIIVTNGDPRTDDDNSLVGADFNYRNDDVLDGLTLTGNFWFQHSFTPDTTEGESAWGARVALPNDTIMASLGFVEIGEDYNPALGFVPRRGIQESTAEFRYRFRTAGYFRTIDVGVETLFVTDLSQNPESARVELTIVEIETRHGDEFELEYRHDYEHLTEDFDIFEDVVIPTDEYDFGRIVVRAQFSEQRPLGGEVEVGFGDFFGGTSVETTVELRFVPAPVFEIRAGYEQNAVSLPQGDFTTHLFTLRTIVNFSPDISWTTFLQYDNESETIGINSRLRWIVDPGNEVFFVINQGFDTDESFRVRATITELTAKVAWTFRF